MAPVSRLSLHRGSSRDRARPAGCGFLLLTCIITCLLLLLNGILVTTLYNWFSPLGPDWLEREKVRQFALFVAPVLLILAEWWLVDFLVDRIAGLARRRRRSIIVPSLQA